jgi:hypothetical protein
MVWVDSRIAGAEGQMTQDEFQAWYMASFEALIRAVFRCVQTRNGGSYQNAEDGLQDAILTMLRRWDWYGRRMYRDATGNVMMATVDGKPGNRLFSFVVQSACNAAVKPGPKRIVRSVGEDEDFVDEGETNPASRLIVETKVQFFRVCWERLENGLRKAIQTRCCTERRQEDEPIDQRTYRQSYKGYDLIRRCLVRRGWNHEDTIDVKFSMLSVICGESTGLQMAISS